ncbi:MAG: 1-acyl-sn-glycerol-3-phosphate acyltransferase [Isosphaeraceae bacterium]
MSLWLALGLSVFGALIVAAGCLYAVLPWIIQPLLRVILRLRYRVKVVGLENVPREGPTLIASNHVSWLDGFIVAAFTPRRGKVLVSAGIVGGPILRPIAVRAGIIPTPYMGPRAIRAALQAGAEALDAGDALAVFPEGQISRTGIIGPFQRGLEAMLKGREHIPVIPAGLDNLWGSIFSNSQGRFFRKWPQGWRRTVVLAFGPPVPPPVTAFETRQAVQVQTVLARSIVGEPSQPLDTVDPALPHWDHPELGRLAVSTADINDPAVSLFQTGTKEGTVGTAPPGVALRVVNGHERPCPADTPGRIEALLPNRTGWIDTGRAGQLDRGGFVTLHPD